MPETLPKLKNRKPDIKEIKKRLQEIRHRKEKYQNYQKDLEKHGKNEISTTDPDARLVETEDKYWAGISAINENFVNIPESIVNQYPMLLSGGMWGTIDLTYDETEVHNKKIRPFKVYNGPRNSDNRKGKFKIQLEHEKKLYSEF